MIDKLFSAIVTIGEVSVTLGEMLVALIMAFVNLLQTVILLFNPIGILNDTITGVLLSIKIIVSNVIGFVKSNDGGYDKCSDTGSGIFGFRRRKK